MSLSRPSRAPFWILTLGVLVAAAIWFGAADSPDPELTALDDSTERMPQPRVEDRRAAPVEGVRGQPQPAAARRTTHEWRNLVIRVVRADTCAAIVGAEVFAMSGMGDVLGSRITNAEGLVRDLPERHRLHGIAAWHPDFQLRGHVVRQSEIEVALIPLRHVRVTIEPPHAVAQEWLDSCEKSIYFRFIPDGNPMRRGPDYLEQRLFEHLGLDKSDWPLQSQSVQIPRYLDADARVALRDNSSLPVRLLSASVGMGGLRPRFFAQRRRTVKLVALKDCQRIVPDTTEARIVPDPKSENALILRYSRRSNERGEIWLHLLSNGKTFSTQYSTFEWGGGVATFKVFAIAAGEYHPTVVYKVDGKRVNMIACYPVKVSGRSDYRLIPIEPARLTVRVADASSAVKLHLTSDHVMPTELAPKVDAAGMSYVWPRLRPGKYEVYAHDGLQRSPTRELKLRAGGRATVELTMRPACEVTLVVDRKKIFHTLRIRDRATGFDRTLYHSNWHRTFELDKSQPGVYTLKGRDDVLSLFYGTYDIEAKSEGRTVRRTIVLDTPKKTVRLDE